MELNSDQVDKTLASLTTQGQRVLDYRKAVHGHAMTLPEDMAAIIGTPLRRAIPVLGVVVEAIANKLFTKELTGGQATPRKTLAGWLKTSGFPGRLERKLWEATVRDSYGYVLATWDAATGAPRLTHRNAFDGKEGAVVSCDPATGAPSFGVNVVQMGKDVWADFYYPDHIEKWVKPSGKDWTKRMDPQDPSWPLDWTDLDGQPLGVAIVEFGDGTTVVDGALQLAKDLNDGLVDLQAVSRSQGWPQRVLKGDHTSGYLTNVNGQPLRMPDGTPVRRQIKLHPGSVMVLQGQEAGLDQLPAAGLDPVLIDTYLRLLTWITTVPSHYFTGDWPSGVALLQAEGRLNALAESYQGLLTTQLVGLCRLLARMSGTFGGPKVDPQADLDVAWEPVQIETEDLKRGREAATADLYTAGLISLFEAVKRNNPDWPDQKVQEEVDRIREDKKASAPPQPVPAAGPQVDPAAPQGGPGGSQSIAERAKARAALAGA